MKGVILVKKQVRAVIREVHARQMIIVKGNLHGKEFLRNREGTEDSRRSRISWSSSSKSSCESTGSESSRRSRASSRSDHDTGQEEDRVDISCGEQTLPCGDGVNEEDISCDGQTLPTILPQKNSRIVKDTQLTQTLNDTSSLGTFSVTTVEKEQLGDDCLEDTSLAVNEEQLEPNANNFEAFMNGILDGDVDGAVAETIFRS